MPSSSADRNPVEQLAEEFADRLRRGERPSLSEYIEKYPQHADEIRDVFPALVMMEQFKPGSEAHTGAFEGPLLQASQPLEQLGDYQIIREVGRGGMGVVYEAEQVSLGRHVALKVLPPGALLNPTFLQRFHREARAAARLHHTNIVPVFGVGESDGVHFYAMQFIQGEPLDRILRDLRDFRNSETPAQKPSEGSIVHGLLSGRFTASLADQGQLESSAPTAAVESRSTTLSAGGGDAGYHRSVARVGLQVAEALAYAPSPGSAAPRHQAFEPPARYPGNGVDHRLRPCQG